MYTVMPSNNIDSLLLCVSPMIPNPLWSFVEYSVKLSLLSVLYFIILICHVSTPRQTAGPADYNTTSD